MSLEGDVSKNSTEIKNKKPERGCSAETGSTASKNTHALPSSFKMLNLIRILLLPHPYALRAQLN